MSHCFLPKLREYLCFDEPKAEKRLSVLWICLYEWHFKDKKRNYYKFNREEYVEKQWLFVKTGVWQRVETVSLRTTDKKSANYQFFVCFFFDAFFFLFLNFVILFKQMYIYKMLPEKCFRMQNKKNNRTHKPEECRMDRRSV